ncbi:MAG: PAS domain-containing protein [Smithella sp.]
MTEAFAILDTSGRIQESNRAYQTIMGYSEEEMSTFLIRYEAGNPIGMWAIVHDITEQKRMEEERRRIETRTMAIVRSALNRALGC